ncbi:N66 matrix protein-like [Helianthus annuus]|uniref:N66 matrix protein-like n=1 Tax=Helianthus annuus TaxID=4232 RepID=UPI000B902360|nr:N66 matrix protein-like [Helianthus annuus]
MVTTSKPPTITEAIDLSVALTEEAIRLNKFSTSVVKKKETHVESSGENKRKFSNFKKGTQGSSSGTNKKRDANLPVEVRTGATSSENKGKGCMGTLPKCDICQHHHTGRCRYGKWENCGKVGHAREACWYGAGRRNGGSGGNGNGNHAGNGNGNQTGNRNQGGIGNSAGNGNRGGSGNQAGNGNRGATNNQCGNGNGNGNGNGRVFNIGAREAHQDPNVVTGTIPINQHFASVLFDTGADYSFV